jgi:tetratricopeptide (TPR) repeat protein
MLHILLASYLVYSSPSPEALATVREQAAAAIPTQAAAVERLAQAEARYRTALMVTPGIAAYHESLALVLEREGRLEDALESHARAVQLDSLAFRNRAGYGMLLSRLGRSADAIPQLSAASRIDGGSVEVRTALARALAAQGRQGDTGGQPDVPDSGIERGLSQANATAPGKDRPNAVAATEDHPIGRAIRDVVQWITGSIMVGAGIALLLPILTGALLALSRLSRGRARTRPRA